MEGGLEGKASTCRSWTAENAIAREFHVAIGSIFMHFIDFSLPPVSGLPTKVEVGLLVEGGAQTRGPSPPSQQK